MDGVDRSTATGGARFARVPILNLVTGAVSLPASLYVCAALVLGIVQFNDVGYPDSAILLRVAHTATTGEVYPDYQRPPFLISPYGPLTYVLQALPYRLASGLGWDPLTAIRFSVAAAFLCCVATVALLTWRVTASRVATTQAGLLATALSPLATWTTQLRGDLWAVLFSLGAMGLMLRQPTLRSVAAAALLAGMAMVVKQTFATAAIAGMIWLLVRRHYSLARLWVGMVIAAVAGGYGLTFWREPGMLDHVMALSDPIIDVEGAWRLFFRVAAQPVFPLSVCGALVALAMRRAELMLFTLFWVLAWALALVTSLQVGANVNYFWEPLLASTAMAAIGLSFVERRASPSGKILLAAMLLWYASDPVAVAVRNFRQTYTAIATVEHRRSQWHAFVSTLRGQRLLSNVPAISVLSRVPEVPDPYLNTVLEMTGKWSYERIIDQVERREYDYVIARTLDGRYRGIPLWSNSLQASIRSAYTPLCEFDGMHVWVPRTYVLDERITPVRPPGCFAIASKR